MIQTTPPNHALQRTRPSHHCCNRGVSRAGSLSLGLLGGTESHRTMTPQVFVPSSAARAERVASFGGLPSVAGWRESVAMSTPQTFSAPSFARRSSGATPNHALQRTRPSRPGCNPTPSWAGSLSLGR